MNRCVVLFLLLALSPGPPAADAQTLPDPSATADLAPPPAHVSLIEGTVTVEHEGLVDAAAANAPLLEGDRIRTAEGHAELILSDGSILHLDRYTSLDLLSASLVRLLEGRVFLTVAGTANVGSAPYRIDGPGASVQIESPGEYRVAVIADRAGGSQVELAVARGWAQIFNERGATGVAAGERSVVFADAAPGPVSVYNAAGYDAFDRWSEDRRSARAGAASAHYLPSNLYAYAGTFEQQGRWDNQSPYGWVWYPTVPAGWRPYYHGSWTPYRSGVAWVGWDPWDWPTHHYGSWSISGGGSWFWIPGRVWSPAWVAWATAPGYVAWCPLGYNGQPVIGLGVGVGYGRARWNSDPWFAWSVTPRSSFRHRVPVYRYAVGGRTLPPRARESFVVHDRGSAYRRHGPSPYRDDGPRANRPGGVAVPRAAAAPRSVDRASRVPGPPRTNGRWRPGVPSARRPQEGRAPVSPPSVPDVSRRRAIPRGGLTGPPANGGAFAGNPRSPRRPFSIRPAPSAPAPPPSSWRPDGRRSAATFRRRPPDAPSSVERPTRPSPAEGSQSPRSPQSPQRRAVPRSRAPQGESTAAPPPRSRRDGSAGSSGSSRGGRVAGRRGPR